MGRCTATSKGTGKQCKRNAKPGYKVCKFHGAGGKKPGGAPITNGYGANVELDRLKDLLERCQNLPDPLSLYEDLALQRTLFLDFINRYAENQEALLAWHKSWQMHQSIPENCYSELEELIDEFEARGTATDRQDELIAKGRDFLLKARDLSRLSKPRQILDISDGIRQLDSIGKMVERIRKLEFMEAIPRSLFTHVITNFTQVVQAHVHDEDTLIKIKHGWESVSLGMAKK